jgi:ACS family hexuronate transporter-like MFS transporter
MSTQVRIEESVEPVQLVNSWRWIAISVFVLSSTLNYLDRQLLAAVAPLLRSEFHLSNAQYGTILSAFSLTYMLMAPAAGLFVDWAGLNVGVTLAVAFWSVAGAATGFVNSLRGLVICRMGLGWAEAASIPCSSKASASYLSPSELGLGDAFHAVGISLGSIVAPLVASVLVPRFGWRSAFFFCGIAGLIWVPLWWLTSRRIPKSAAPRAKFRKPVSSILRDRRFWGILGANAFIMMLFSLWTNWTTLYFVEQFHITASEANRYFAWIPAVFATIGGFLGGWLAFRSIGAGMDVLKARLRICRAVAPLLLITAFIPLIHAPGFAAIAIGTSFFLCMTILTNLHVMPIDLFGVERAAFTAAALTFSYALLQTIISPVIGLLVDRFGFPVVCVAFSVFPVLGGVILGFFVMPAEESLHSGAVYE